jgi:hypothetical protein
MSGPRAGDIIAKSMLTGGTAIGVAGCAAGTAAGVTEAAHLGILGGLAIADAAAAGAITGVTIGTAGGALIGVAIVGGIALMSSSGTGCTCGP